MVKRIHEKLQKASKDIDYTKKLLIDCKTWNGPVTSGKELIKAVKSGPSQEKFILRTELACYIHTHRGATRGMFGWHAIPLCNTY